VLMEFGLLGLSATQSARITPKGGGGTVKSTCHGRPDEHDFVFCIPAFNVRLAVCIAAGVPDRRFPYVTRAQRARAIRWNKT
jgi:hypothetical protein